MIHQRSSIVSVFSDPKHLFCDLGFFADGDPLDGTKVVFYPTGRIKETTIYKNGLRSLAIHYYSNNCLSSSIHFRNGEKHGEAYYCDNGGRILRHVLYDGPDMLKPTDENKSRFIGYLTHDDDFQLTARYEPMGRAIRELLARS